MTSTASSCATGTMRSVSLLSPPDAPATISRIWLAIASAVPFLSGTSANDMRASQSVSKLRTRFASESMSSREPDSTSTLCVLSAASEAPGGTNGWMTFWIWSAVTYCSGRMRIALPGIGAWAGAPLSAPSSGMTRTRPLSWTSAAPDARKMRSRAGSTAARGKGRVVSTVTVPCTFEST